MYSVFGISSVFKFNETISHLYITAYNSPVLVKEVFKVAGASIWG